MPTFENTANGPFEPTWESLRTYTAPDWFRDAKFGIWSHWGPQSVPMFGDWYARHMYMEGTPQYLHHWRTYGHPSKVGWKDMVKLWKAEKFDPEALMQRYVDAGAKYFMAQAVHHDNFDNWNSTHNRFNSVNMGPQKDIVGLWQKAAKAHGLPFGVSEHLGATFSWWAHNKGADSTGPYAGVPYDGNDPDYEDFYLPNQDEPRLKNQGERWYTDNPWWFKQWYQRIKDVIEQYHPELLYSDGPVPFNEYGLNIIAHMYNDSIARNGSNQAVYNQKDKNPLVYKVGVLDIERNVQNAVAADPWQTDTCVGGWFYDVRAVYKTSTTILEMLVDIVAKNGNLMLNFLQKPDGTLDDEQYAILDDIQAWTSVNGEGIFGTRPWHIGMEGDTNASQERFKEDALDYTPADFRFTSKDKVIYAFQMAWPEDGMALINSLVAGRGCAKLHMADIESVELLGSDARLHAEWANEGLLITGLPDENPVQCAHCFKITTK